MFKERDFPIFKVSFSLSFIISFALAMARTKRSYKPMPVSTTRASSSIRRARAVAAARGITRRLPTGELKFLDTSKGNTLISSTGTVLDDSLNHIAQGTDESERIGRKCTVQALHIRGEIYIPSTTNAQSCSDVVRVIVYVDKQTNGSAASVTDLLESAAYNSFANLTNSGRFLILSNSVRVVNCTAGAGADTATDVYADNRVLYQFDKKCNIPLEFSSTTGAISELRSNNIGVMAISSRGLCYINYNARIRYSDN